VRVKVLTTKSGITVSGLDFENTVLDFKDGDIESTTTKIVDGNNLITSLVETIGKSSGSRLVDDTEDVKTGNLTGILGSLTLSIVEVGRNSNDGVVGLLTEETFSSFLHLTEDKRTNLGRRVLLALSLNPSVTIAVRNNIIGDSLCISLHSGIGESTTNKTLGSIDGVGRVDNSLKFTINTNNENPSSNKQKIF
jgi:hypothetical protein